MRHTLIMFLFIFATALVGCEEETKTPASKASQGASDDGEDDGEDVGVPSDATETGDAGAPTDAPAPVTP
jgi:hypothetical protein